jgi:DMSO/TMAO reductase YedYZ molybdopterin-dependent catalytic subunit
MNKSLLDRRGFVRMLASVGGFAAFSGQIGGALQSAVTSAGSSFLEQTAKTQQLARYPEKTDLILLTDRPPQLETPLRYFQSDLTPNDAFFVRWHLSGIPTVVDLRTFRLEVKGEVQKPLSLSVHDLKTKFEPVEVVALCQCAGNARSLFEPSVPGGQWTNGAMGNARWKGARLKDVLDAAGVLPKAVQIGLTGLDTPAIPATPRFEKSLEIEHARDGNVMVAYEMNGQPLPMLNGFPLRIVVPGWYGTYWVKALSSITVLDQPLKTFWMDKAYRIPNNPFAQEDPQTLASTTVPISHMAVRSIFVSPGPEEEVQAGSVCRVQGVANDGGSGIRKVEFSSDGGASWSDALLGNDLGNFSWRLWHTDWKPTAKGSYRLMVRATNREGISQPVKQWNRSGYQRAVIEQINVQVV